jgi:putative tryptophan/tyrosine transport system substrate-binding protein
VDVIVTQGTQATVAAKQATNLIPIVVGAAGDLVGEGLVFSLARPGGNVTGFTNYDPDLSAKRLQLLRETFPKFSRVAVLYHGGAGGD